MRNKKPLPVSAGDEGIWRFNETLEFLHYEVSISLENFAKILLLQVSLEKRQPKEQIGGGFMRTKVKVGVGL